MTSETPRLRPDEGQHALSADHKMPSSIYPSKHINTFGRRGPGGPQAPSHSKGSSSGSEALNATRSEGDESADDGTLEGQPPPPPPSNIPLASHLPTLRYSIPPPRRMNTLERCSSPFLPPNDNSYRDEEEEDQYGDDEEEEDENEGELRFRRQRSKSGLNGPNSHHRSRSSSFIRGVTAEVSRISPSATQPSGPSRTFQRPTNPVYQSSLTQYQPSHHGSIASTETRVRAAVGVTLSRAGSVNSEQPRYSERPSKPYGSSSVRRDRVCGSAPEPIWTEFPHAWSEERVSQALATEDPPSTSPRANSRVDERYPTAKPTFGRGTSPRRTDILPYIPSTASGRATPERRAYVAEASSTSFPISTSPDTRQRISTRGSLTMNDVPSGSPLLSSPRLRYQFSSPVRRSPDDVLGVEIPRPRFQAEDYRSSWTGGNLRSCSSYQDFNACGNAARRLPPNEASDEEEDDFVFGLELDQRDTKSMHTYKTMRSMRGVDPEREAAKEEAARETEEIMNLATNAVQLEAEMRKSGEEAKHGETERNKEEAKQMEVEIRQRELEGQDKHANTFQRCNQPRRPRSLSSDCMNYRDGQDDRCEEADDEEEGEPYISRKNRTRMKVQSSRRLSSSSPFTRGAIAQDICLPSINSEGPMHAEGTPDIYGASFLQRGRDYGPAPQRPWGSVPRTLSMSPSSSMISRANDHRHITASPAFGVGTSPRRTDTVLYTPSPPSPNAILERWSYAEDESRMEFSASPGTRHTRRRNPMGRSFSTDDPPLLPPLSSSPSLRSGFSTPVRHSSGSMWGIKVPHPRSQEDDDHISWTESPRWPSEDFHAYGETATHWTRLYEASDAEEDDFVEEIWNAQNLKNEELERQLARREEAAREMEEEAKKVAAEARQLEAQVRQLGEEARRKHEEAGRIEEEAKRREIDIRRRELEVRRKEEQVMLKEDETKQKEGRAKEQVKHRRDSEGDWKQQGSAAPPSTTINHGLRQNDIVSAPSGLRISPRLSQFRSSACMPEPVAAELGALGIDQMSRTSGTSWRSIFHVHRVASRRNVHRTAGARLSNEQMTRFSDARGHVIRAVKFIVGQTVDITHEALTLGVDIVDYIPIPGLAPAAHILLSIWNAFAEVQSNHFSCIRLVERCANILLSVRDEIVDAGNAVNEELKYPIRKLHESFADVLKLLRSQLDMPFLKRFLGREQVLQEIERCDASLTEALGRLGFSIQIRTLKLIQVNQTNVLSMLETRNQCFTSKSKIHDSLGEIQAQQDLEDRAQDFAQLRQLLRTAVQTTDDVAMVEILQIGFDEMPEAMRALEHALQNHKRSKTTDSEQTDDGLDRKFMENGVEALRRLTTHVGTQINLPSWTISRFEINLDRRIGIGLFSDVYKGTWRNRVVAIKMLADATSQKLFVHEADIWKSLSHPNIVQLLGASSTSSEPPWFFVSPYCVNGNLIKYLKDLPTLKHALALRVMHEISSGMAYLHEHGVLHGDLKAVNVLVDDGHRCIITDFGQSELKSEVYRITRQPVSRGTLRWQAPELMCGATALTQQMDIYAFAITCVEVITKGSLPWLLQDDADVRYTVLVRQDRLPLSSSDFTLDEGLREMIHACWHQEPSCRPPFSRISYDLSNLRSTLNGCAA